MAFPKSTMNSSGNSSVRQIVFKGDSGWQKNNNYATVANIIVKYLKYINIYSNNSKVC